MRALSRNAGVDSPRVLRELVAGHEQVRASDRPRDPLARLQRRPAAARLDADRV